ncbi:MAG TPA: hypothetical protein VLK03_11485 [Nocardioides sp.]|nr:hypothetical protein [Nocardioides sp.]
MLRVTTLVALLSAALLLSSCTTSGGGGRTDDPADPATAAGCGECTEELGAVRRDIEALPDVKELLTLETYTESPTNGAGVRVELRSRSAGDTAVVDEVGKILWQSRIAPLDEVFVTVEDGSGQLVRGSSPFDFTEAGRERGGFEDQWGPRPVDE